MRSMWWWRQKVHSSWLVALVSISFVAGVSLVLAVRIPWGLGALAAVGVLVFCVFLQVRWTLPLISIAAVLTGLGYGSAHAGSRDAYLALMGEQVTLSGVLKEDASKSSFGSSSLQLKQITIKQKNYPGVVLVTVRSPPPILRGDVVYTEGVMHPGFGSFPAVLSRAQILLVRPPPVADTGRRVRDWFAEKVRQVLSEPQASLGIGFLTGQKSALPDDLSEALKTVGLTHIVVASGYNLTLLVRLARRIFKNASKYLSAVFSGIMVICFIAVTGASPSMTRAGLVSGLSIISWYYGRAMHPLVMLPFVAAITVAIQPSFVWGDVGWQLSFAAFAGVMILAPLLQRYFFEIRPPKLIWQIMGETVAAHLVTMPVIALSFGTMSNVAIVANLLVVPLVPIAMLLTFLVGVWSIIGLGFGGVVAAPAEWLLGYMTHVALYLSELSWAQSETALSPLVWLGYGVALGVACWWMQRVTKYDFRSGEVF